MTTIRAFVGHSFEDEDVPVVSKFLRYFEQLSKLNQNFTWQNAEPAEPKLLTTKVRQLFVDKNLFIGICTKREAVVSRDALSYVTFRHGYMKARKEEFQWKTSDWIIQEIGLAIGRGMEIILLIEEGARPPGGLQGDLEYIPFTRDAIGESFQKIAEMITSLTPKNTALSLAEPESRSPPEEKSDPSSANNDWITPKPEWTLDDYQFGFFHCIFKDRQDDANQINDAFLSSTINSEEATKIRWEAYKEYISIMFDKGGDLQRLKRMAESNLQDADINYYLARILDKYERHEEAAIAFTKAATEESNKSLAVNYFGEAARAYQKAGKIEAVEKIVNRLKELANENGLEVESLNSQRQLAELTNSNELLIATMERLLATDPTNHDLRFKLAYKYSELEIDNLSMFHYLKIPQESRSAASWNNLGVAFDKNSLQAKSVAAYRKAENMDETLAMSNLANKYLTAGFLDEAKQLCEKALALPNSHKNVATTLASIKEVPEKERESSESLLKKAKPISEYYIDLGHAATKGVWPYAVAKWQSPDCVLTPKREGSKMTATGSYIRENAGLRGLLFGAVGAENTAESQIYSVTYTGSIEGHAFIGHVVRNIEGEEPKLSSLVGASKEEIKCLMILDDDEIEIRVLEQKGTDTPRFYKLTKILS